MPSSHFTKLARTLARLRRRIEEGEGEGSASLIDQVYGARREAARRPPLLAHSRLRYTISPLVSTHVRVVYTLFLYVLSVLSQYIIYNKLFYALLTRFRVQYLQFYFLLLKFAIISNFYFYFYY